MLVPFVFVVLAFASQHPRAPGAVAKAMALTLAIGIPVSALAADAATGFVAGIGAGGVVALRADVERPWKARMLAVLMVTAWAFVTVRVVPEAARPDGADLAVHRAWGSPTICSCSGGSDAQDRPLPRAEAEVSVATASPSRDSRRVPIAIVPGSVGTVTGPSDRLTATIVAGPAAPGPRARGRGERRVGARPQIRRSAAQGDQVAAQVEH